MCRKDYFQLNLKLKLRNVVFPKAQHDVLNMSCFVQGQFMSWSHIFWAGNNDYYDFTVNMWIFFLIHCLVVWSIKSQKLVKNV